MICTSSKHNNLAYERVYPLMNVNEILGSNSSFSNASMIFTFKHNRFATSSVDNCLARRASASNKPGESNGVSIWLDSVMRIDISFQ